jgi:hypothetical protein
MKRNRAEDGGEGDGDREDNLKRLRELQTVRQEKIIAFCCSFCFDLRMSPKIFLSWMRNNWIR